MKPFLRWAGGKSKVVQHLVQYVPSHYGAYWEPFLGAGALFFRLAPEAAYLSDLNEDLIECFRHVRANPDLIHRYLREHARRTSEDYYYLVRDKYNSGRTSFSQAARFIYLNKTNFNGIFRVNLGGEYNVPYGHKDPPALPSLDDLRTASDILSSAKLETGSFEGVLLATSPQEGDLVYLDPPYPPLNETAYFRHYTRHRFSLDDHKRVAQVAELLRGKGVFVMVSNADIAEIRSLYRDWYRHKLPVVRWVAANGNRTKVSELVITSYDASANGRMDQ
jgi:DNA adenine methylase